MPVDTLLNVVKEKVLSIRAIKDTLSRGGMLKIGETSKEIFAVARLMKISKNVVLVKE